MAFSIFDLFSIGIGPSSSHTVGPMRAAGAFVEEIKEAKTFTDVTSIHIELYGSLALTGAGHGTDLALMLGLEGCSPDSVEAEVVLNRPEEISTTKTLLLGGEKQISFDPKEVIAHVCDELLLRHSNGMKFIARSSAGTSLLERDYYSIGGGFVVDADASPVGLLTAYDKEPPFPFTTARELLDHCHSTSCPIHEVVWQNELSWRAEDDVRQRLQEIAAVMLDSIDAGLKAEGTLPGSLNVKRRAPELYRKYHERQQQPEGAKFDAMDALSAYAIAVNEQNAAFGRIVTAPTNGAAGVIPAVLRFYLNHMENATEDAINVFLLTAGAVGILFKEGASLSAAEVGCQGEVGVACSMAAAGFAAILGGSNEQIENAAEIGMEHNLGLTCDPIGGLVQIPCIERNAMGAVKAVNAARLAMQSSGRHKVSLDEVIAAMKKTGEDMMVKYKETSQGGLALTVAIPEC